MKYINGTEFHLRNTVVTLGKFDGLHLGHCKLINYILSCGKQGYQSVVFTFAFHPFNLFSERELQMILTEDEKRFYLEQINPDVMIAYPFTRETAEMDAETFIQKILVEQLDAKTIVVGDDFCFGYKRKGNVELLQKLSAKYHYKVVAMKKEQVYGQDISSSTIRQHLASGNLSLVAKMLGQPYKIRGEVIYGKQIGRTLGMPTANIIPGRSKLLPPFGVYASVTKVNGSKYFGITNIGLKPTIIGVNDVGVETFLFDTHENIYGQIIEVQLYTFVRAEKKFQSLEELKVQMQLDRQVVNEFFDAEFNLTLG